MEHCFDYISDVIIDMKAHFTDPYLFIAGYFNQWKVEDGLQDFQDKLGRQVEDRIICNVLRSVESSGTFAPLETEDSTGLPTVGFGWRGGRLPNGKPTHTGTTTQRQRRLLNSGLSCMTGQKSTGLSEVLTKHQSTRGPLPGQLKLSSRSIHPDEVNRHPLAQ